MLIYPVVFCYLDPFSLSKSNQASEEPLEGTTEKKIILLYVVNKVTAQSRHTNGSEIPTEMSLSTESKLRKITLCVGRKIDFLRSLQKGKDKKNYL